MSKFSYNLSLDELKKRTNPEYLLTKSFLSNESPEYLLLSEGDKSALKYLVKAAYILGRINLRLDNCHNIEVEEWLNKEASSNSEYAILTKILFDAQKGVNALDNLANNIKLVKEIDDKEGKGFYPEDLTIEEFHRILMQMLKSGMNKEVAKILTQRSVVVRDGNILKGIDYVDYFRKEFEEIANELEMASKVSSNKDFNEYLLLQAEALRNADPMLDAYADKKWAELQETPLEFTIVRENYDDKMTTSIASNRELLNELKKASIAFYAKDSIGGRVGIVNDEGTKKLFAIKKFIPIIANLMPYNDEYKQLISNDNIKQTMVDVDMIMVTGHVGEYRGGIVMAENLPNADKLSLTIGGGRRNVYHRQIRFVSDENALNKKLELILDPTQIRFYNEESSHLATIGHENAHSLGPKEEIDKLGEFKNIIEENKADMIAIGYIDELVKNGLYSDELGKSIIVTEIVKCFLKAKPNITQAHRVRTVMQNKYFFDNGGYKLTSEGKISINIDSILSIARNMLREIIRIQIDKDIEKARGFVDKYFIWTVEMQTIADKLNSIDKFLNGKVSTPLADYLLLKNDKRV